MPSLRLDPKQAPVPLHAAQAPSARSIEVPHEPTPEELLSGGAALGVTSLEARQQTGLPVSEIVSQASAVGGCAAVLAMMRDHVNDAEFQFWCCDALAGLCAGHEEIRAAVYAGGGTAQVLATMRLFSWDEGVQTKAMMMVANLAADYAEFVGKSGGVEAVVAAMKACPDAYQVLTSGTRALQNLVAGSDANRARAVAAGAEAQIEGALERNVEDGQLQWRGRQLLRRLAAPIASPRNAAGLTGVGGFGGVNGVGGGGFSNGNSSSSLSLSPSALDGEASPEAVALASSGTVATDAPAPALAPAPPSSITAADAAAAPASARPAPRVTTGDEFAEGHTAEELEVSKRSSWSRLANAIFQGHAKEIAAGNVPGLHGISAQVAQRVAAAAAAAPAEERGAAGVRATLDFLRTHRGYHEAEAWCCDALSTLMSGDAAARRAAFEGGAIALVLDAMRSAVWEEDVQLKCVWALLALSADYAAAISEGEGMHTIVGAMLANKTAHQLQVSAVKLLSLLTLPGSAGAAANLAAAREVSAVPIVRAVIAAHESDGTLQYRGVNLLERLEPGVTLQMPHLALIRSSSMAAEEAVVARRSLSTRADLLTVDEDDGDNDAVGLSAASAGPMHGTTTRRSLVNSAAAVAMASAGADFDDDYVAAPASPGPVAEGKGDL